MLQHTYCTWYNCLCGSGRAKWKLSTSSYTVYRGIILPFAIGFWNILCRMVTRDNRKCILSILLCLCCFVPLPYKTSRFRNQKTLIDLSLAYFYSFLWMLCKDGQNSEGEDLLTVHHTFTSVVSITDIKTIDVSEFDPPFPDHASTRYATIR